MNISRQASVLRLALFDGSKIGVTGGGRGINRCTAHELALLGGTSVILGRDGTTLEAVVQEIVSDGCRVAAPIRVRHSSG